MPSCCFCDVVYETIIQGPGYTRYTAIYNDVHPEKVGSVRSARPYHALLRDEWDCPIVFGSSSGSDAYDIYDYFKDTGLPQSLGMIGWGPNHILH